MQDTGAPPLPQATGLSSEEVQDTERAMENTCSHLPGLLDCCELASNAFWPEGGGRGKHAGLCVQSVPQGEDISEMPGVRWMLGAAAWQDRSPPLDWLQVL